MPLLSEIDFGLVVLIWMTQLIVYPGFLYYSEKDLIQWHQRYTPSITLIVGPLMLAQVGLHIWAMMAVNSTLQIIQVVLIGVIWGLTFFKAVPFHGKIQEGEEVQKNAKALVKWNWPRTMIWTAVFALNFLG